MIFSKKSSVQKAYLDYINNVALPEFHKGNTVYCNILQGAFAFPKEKDLQIKVAAAYDELLSRISSKRLIRLSEEARKFFYDERRKYWYELDWKSIDLSRRRLSHLTDDQYSAVLKMGTFMSDGYYRQQCVERLNGFAGALPYFILRLNDWVVQVRECAFIMAQSRIQKCNIVEIFASLSMMEKVKCSGRRSDEHIFQIEEGIKETLAQMFCDISEQTLNEIHCYEVNMKNAIYRLISQDKMVGRAAMEKLLSLEKASYGKTLLIRGIFDHYGYEPFRINQYLKSKSAVVRYYALQFRYEQEHQAWDGLEEMLLDRSARIRDHASYILEKHTDIRVLDFYLDRLAGQVSKIVLLGIGEHGSEEEADVVSPFLESSEEQIAAAALEAYGKLVGEGGAFVYWKSLNDSRPSVSGKAYRLIKKYRIRYGASQIYDAFLQNRKTVLGGYLLKLLLREPSWERLPYLLMLYGDKDLSDADQNLIEAGIKSRYVYAKISMQQEQKILDILEQKNNQIPEEIKKAIKFDLKHVVIRN